jgi:membrane-anchored mycosin MYCP
VKRWAGALTILLLVAGPALAPAPALAVEPPVVGPGPPPVGPVAPPTPTQQKAACGVGAVFPGSQFGSRPVADAMLNYSGAWAFSRGAGQKVAVIDTGVTPNPRLPGLQAGGDYVSTSDGLIDCDAHGTLVAGVIAAAPSPDDAFAGVAPDATILSIRQNSGSYSAQGVNTAQNDPNALSQGYGNTFTLALAIVHAVDLGATVINLSEVACAPVGVGIDDAGLGQAIRYAYERNIVIVAAAGNVSSGGLCGTQNEVRDPNLPLADAWGSVRTIASPAWFSDYVLTVGAVTVDGQPSDFSLHGPWIDVAAPGENVTSLSSNGIGLTNAWQNPPNGLAGISGTSFAAGFVSGVVALIRARFPSMTAEQVMERVKRTAHTPDAGPNDATGYGVVDPVAALTEELPAQDEASAALAGHAIRGPAARNPGDHRARNTMLAVLGVCIAGAAVVAALIKRPVEK